MEGAIFSRRRLFGKLFEPNVDFYQLLNKQSAKTLEGMHALVEWLKHEEQAEKCQSVRDLETEADLIKFDVAKRLVDSFITPFDREDIYELSQRLDEVINGAKYICREIEAFDTKPSMHPEIVSMAEILVEGTQALCQSFAALEKNHEEAQKQAIVACKSANKLSKLYRRSMQELFNNDDIKTILRVKEVYKAMVTCSERIDLVGERLLHSIVKFA